MAAKDLVPLLSWLVLWGRCRYCKWPISWQYPIVELTTAVVFISSYLFWTGGLHSHGTWLLFITWLATAVGLLALAVYDLKWMLLPNRILYPTLFVALAGRAGYILFFAVDKLHSLWSLTLSLLTASGIFLLIYIVSGGRWIGFGDVRLGLITGTILASAAKSLLMIFLASLFGTLFVLPALLHGQKNLEARLPYGPFLIAACGLVLLFGQRVIDWYGRLLM